MGQKFTGPSGITNAAGVVKNPATEEKQDNIITELQSIAGLSIPEHNYIGVTYPSDTQEVYTYKTGGSGGTTVGTITVNYTDATKEVLSNVTKS